MRPHLSAKRRAIFEELEGRQLLSSRVVELLGTGGDDHIVITFDALTRDATVSGASNVADGTLYAASVHNDQLHFFIDAGAGNDRVEMGLEQPAGVWWQDVAAATMVGGAGDDLLVGGMGWDTFDGGEGNDTIIGTAAGGPEVGGGGDQMRFGRATHGVYLNLADGKVYDDGTGGSDEVSGISAAVGTPFDDKMFSGSVSGGFDGGAGNDYLNAKTAHGFELGGGDGDDTLIGGEGHDQFYPGEGNDRMFGGGDATDIAFIGDEQATHGVIIRLDRNTVEDDGSGGRDVVKRVNIVFGGTRYSDIIYGNSADNEFIVQSGGVDVVYGGDGNDRIVIDEGIMLGGRGDDDLNSNTSRVLVKGGPGHDRIGLYGPRFSIERIVVGAGDSVVDQRYEPDPTMVAPVNDLVFPPPVKRSDPPAEPVLGYDWVLRRLLWE